MAINTASIETSVLGVAGYLTKSLAGWASAILTANSGIFAVLQFANPQVFSSIHIEIETQSQHNKRSRSDFKLNMTEFPNAET